MNLDNLSYDKLTLCLRRLVSQYPFLRMFSVGKSCMGRDIWCIRVGKGDKKILIISAHHALEWITSALAVGFVRDFSHCLRENHSFMGADTYGIYSKVQYYIIPMLNPDGVDIVINSIEESHPFYKHITSVIQKQQIPTLWQANIRGVDLNHNYDLRFCQGKSLAEKMGISSPYYTRYSGEYPFSEPETDAVRKLCHRISFHSAISLHTQGEVIYAGDMSDEAYSKFAVRLSDVSGYELSEPEGVASCSGFKDWAMGKMGIPSFTIELGMGKNPLPFSQFEKITKPCYNIITESANH